MAEFQKKLWIIISRRDTGFDQDDLKSLHYIIRNSDNAFRRPKKVKVNGGQLNSQHGGDSMI